MDKYCKSCGAHINDNTKFCGTCGKPVDIINQTTYETPKIITPVKVNKRPNKKIKTIILITIIAGVFLLLCFAIWNTGETMGVWRDIEINQAKNQWKKQDDIKIEEKAILECLNNFADAVENNDTEAALAFVTDDKKDEFRNLLTANAEKTPVLVKALRNTELTYLSTDTGNYEAIRMAEVIAGVGENKNDMLNTFTVILVKTEKGWTVDSL
jgi:uncharacterized membrane protein YvbJ